MIAATEYRVVLPYREFRVWVANRHVMKATYLGGLLVGRTLGWFTRWAKRQRAQIFEKED